MIFMYMNFQQHPTTSLEKENLAKRKQTRLEKVNETKVEVVSEECHA